MRKALIFIILVTIFTFKNSDAQNIFWGINIGTTSLQGSDAYTDEISSGGAGFSTEFHAGALIKLQVPISPLTPVIFFNYHALRGSQNGTETSQSIYSLGIGGQFTITSGYVSPYVALDASYNFFGKYVITNPPPGYLANSETNGPSSLSAKSRVGGGIAFGVDLNFFPGIDIDLSGRLMILNLLGKKNSEDNLQSLTFNAAILF